MIVQTRKSCTNSWVYVWNGKWKNEHLVPFFVELNYFMCTPGELFSELFRYNPYPKQLCCSHFASCRHWIYNEYIYKFISLNMKYIVFVLDSSYQWKPMHSVFIHNLLIVLTFFPTSSVINTTVQLGASTCGVLCLPYFQNFPELTRCASRGSRAVLSFWSSRDSSLFTPNRELVSMRTYLASLSSSVTLLENRGNQWLWQNILSMCPHSERMDTEISWAKV